MPSSRGPPDPGMEPASLTSPSLAVRFFFLPLAPLGKPNEFWSRGLQILVIRSLFVHSWGGWGQKILGEESAQVAMELGTWANQSLPTSKAMSQVD